MFKVVVFDLDGTLIDSIEIWLSLFTKVLKKYKINMDKESIKNQFGKQDKEILSSFIPNEKRNEIINFLKLKKIIKNS